MTRPVATAQDLEGTEAAPADHGLFGPGSATWQLMGEPILWVAGIRALYLQALHPRTMLGTRRSIPMSTSAMSTSATAVAWLPHRASSTRSWTSSASRPP